MRRSEMIEGTERNWNWPVRFDKSGSFLGITQFDEGGRRVKDRVLLSPKQVEELTKFLGTQ